MNDKKTAQSYVEILEKVFKKIRTIEKEQKYFISTLYDIFEIINNWIEEKITVGKVHLINAEALLKDGLDYRKEDELILGIFQGTFSLWTKDGWPVLRDDIISIDIIDTKNKLESFLFDLVTLPSYAEYIRELSWIKEGLLTSRKNVTPSNTPEMGSYPG